MVPAKSAGSLPVAWASTAAIMIEEAEVEAQTSWRLVPSRA
jgi:hypothetical protein